MNPRTFLSLFEKLEGFVHRLPESLQQPILREITPIKTLFLLQRGPRIVLLGDREASKAAVFNALFGGEVLSPLEDSLHDGAWQSLRRTGRGGLDLLDARRPVSVAAAQTALATGADLVIFLSHSGEATEELAADLEQAKVLLDGEGAGPRILGLLYGEDEQARSALHSALHSVPGLERRMMGTFCLREGEEHIGPLVEAIGAELPPEAQLELARLSGNRVLQGQIAQVVIKSVTAICAAIGAQPIPLADFPILTSLQTAMVAGIMHISGRELSLRLAGEFLGALGANIGAGLVLREGARAAVKLVPVWGNVISGGVAAAGTYSLGRASVAYFIEGISLEDARGYFRKKPAALSR